MVVSLFYLIASYAQVAGFGFNVDNIFAAAAAPLFALGSPESAGGYGSTFILELLVIVVFLDILAVGVGAATASTRGVFAMARDRRLPGALASVSKKYGTPTGAIVLMMVVMAGFIALNEFWEDLFALPGFPHYFSIFVWASTFGGFALVVVYLLMSVGAFRGLVRPRQHGWGVHRLHRRDRAHRCGDLRLLLQADQPDGLGALVRARLAGDRSDRHDG